MADREAKALKKNGEGRLLRKLAFPKDVEYIDHPHGVRMSAEKVKTLENGGVGKVPPYWAEDKSWVGERTPLINMTPRTLGGRWHEVRTLEVLAFDHNDWMEAREVS